MKIKMLSLSFIFLILVSGLYAFNAWITFIDGYDIEVYLAGKLEQTFYVAIYSERSIQYYTIPQDKIIRIRNNSGVVTNMLFRRADWLDVEFNSNDFVPYKEREIFDEEEEIENSE